MTFWSDVDRPWQYTPTHHQPSTRTQYTPTHHQPSTCTQYTHLTHIITHWSHSQATSWLSVACSMERAWYLFPCEWHQDRKNGNFCTRLRAARRAIYQAHNLHHSYLASGGWLSYTPSVEHVVGWTIYTKHRLIVLTIFAIFYYIVLTWVLFFALQVMKAGGAGEWGHVK